MFNGLAPVLRSILLLNLAILTVMALILTINIGSIFSSSDGASKRDLEEIIARYERSRNGAGPGAALGTPGSSSDLNSEQKPIDYSVVRLFVGILTAPEDLARRTFQRQSCVKQNYDKYPANAGKESTFEIEYKFFVGRPSVGHGSEHNIDGRLANDRELEVSKGLQLEQDAHGDIVMLDFLDNEDAENKIGKTESVFEHGLELALGYSRQGSNKNWKPTHIAKVDGDYCLDATALMELMEDYNDQLLKNHVAALQEEDATEHGETAEKVPDAAGQGNDGNAHGAAWKNTDHVRFTKQELVDNGSGTAKMFTGVSSTIAKSLWDSNGVSKSTSKFIRSSQADDALEFVNSVSRPRLQMIGANMWKKPHYKSQLGVDAGFAPYPSHWLEIMSVGLAEAIFRSDAFHTKNWLTYGSGSEDVMIGRWAAYAIAHHDLVVDYLQLPELKAKVEFQEFERQGHSQDYSHPPKEETRAEAFLQKRIGFE